MEETATTATEYPEDKPASFSSVLFWGTVRAGFETPKNSIQLVSSVSYFASVGAHFIIFSVLARGYSGN